jgi:hypothetical protein
MNHTFLLDAIAFQADLPALLEAMRLRPESEAAAHFTRLARQAERIARPKAIYRLAFIDRKEADQVTIEGTPFTSRVLRVNLEAVNRVFAYVATCGCELEAWGRAFEDFLERFWADALQEAALSAALHALDQHLQENYQPGSVSTMNPGSLEDWPLQEQRPLFSLLGDVTGLTGVRLTESLLMLPAKSVSGLLFASEVEFASCQLCPRAVCPNRRAAYDSQLLATRYQA